MASYPDYSGHAFLQLNKKRTDQSHVLPTHLKGGPWLKHLSKAEKGLPASNSLIARLVRTVLNHAPIGSYRRRFFPFEETNCLCLRHPLEDRDHIFRNCPLYRRENIQNQSTLAGVVEFLQNNPKAFSFEKPTDREIRATRRYNVGGVYPDMRIRQDGDVRAVVMYRPTNRRGHNDDGRRVFFFRPHEVMGMPGT